MPAAVQEVKLLHARCCHIWGEAYGVIMLPWGKQINPTRYDVNKVMFAIYDI